MDVDITHTAKGHSVFGYLRIVFKDDQTLFRALNGLRRNPSL